MPSPDPYDIVLAASVVSFDGRVLELFGHAARTGNRIHVALITAIAEEADKVTITTRGGVDYSIVLAGESDAKRAAIASCVADIRRTAPALGA